MSASHLLPYLVAVAVLMLTPGPDMLFCLATGLRSGPRSGFSAALGTATGEIVHITASAFGLAALFSAAPLVFDGVRILGAAYLVVLGIQALRRRSEQGGSDNFGRHRGSAYRQGVITDLLNPKTALFTIAFLPQFIDPRAGSIVVQYVVLGLVFIGFEILVDGSVGILAGRLANWLSRPRATRRLNLTAGSIYLALGLRIGLLR